MLHLLIGDMDPVCYGSPLTVSMIPCTTINWFNISIWAIANLFIIVNSYCKYISLWAIVITSFTLVYASIHQLKYSCPRFPRITDCFPNTLEILISMYPKLVVPCTTTTYSLLPTTSYSLLTTTCHLLLPTSCYYPLLVTYYYPLLVTNNYLLPITNYCLLLVTY